ALPRSSAARGRDVGAPGALGHLLPHRAPALRNVPIHLSALGSRPLRDAASRAAGAREHASARAGSTGAAPSRLMSFWEQVNGLDLAKLARGFAMALGFVLVLFVGSIVVPGKRVRG